MIYEISLKIGKTKESTKILVDTPNEEEALSTFKRQRIHETGISKKDYVATPYKQK